MNEHIPAISIIIPVYNAEKYLSRCLNSLLNQTFTDFELILVNDGSKDNSQKIIDRYVRKYPDIIISYTQPNNGAASTRNKGIELSRGSYIGFVDSDDYVETDYLERMYATAITGGYDIVMIDCREVNNKGKELRINKTRPISVGNKNCYFANVVWAMLYRREFIVSNKILFPIGKRYEDTVFEFMVQILSKKSIHLDYIGYNYLIHNTASFSYSYRTHGIPDNTFPYKDIEDAMQKVRSSITAKKNDYYEAYVLYILTYSLFYLTRKLDLSVIAYRCNMFKKIISRHLPSYNWKKSYKIWQIRFQPFYIRFIVFVFSVFYQTRLMKYLVFASNLIVRVILLVRRFEK